MLILTVRTDSPQAELGLYEDRAQLAYVSWQAHRELGRTVHSKIKELMESKGHAMDDVAGVVAFRGPGSFTGLRIGLTVADALAYGNACPIVGSMGEQWIEDGLARVLAGEDDRIVTPEYGAEANITTPRK